MKQFTGTVALAALLAGPAFAQNAQGGTSQHDGAVAPPSASNETGGIPEIIMERARVPATGSTSTCHRRRDLVTVPMPQRSSGLWSPLYAGSSRS